MIRGQVNAYRLEYDHLAVSLPPSSASLPLSKNEKELSKRHLYLLTLCLYICEVLSFARAQMCSARPILKQDQRTVQHVALSRYLGPPRYHYSK